MSEQDGGPAFPNTMIELDENGQTSATRVAPGMALRDYFAGLAMQSRIMQGIATWETEKGRSMLSKWSYADADAMLAEREKSK